MDKRLESIIAHEKAARAELDAIHAELEALVDNIKADMDEAEADRCKECGL